MGRQAGPRGNSARGVDPRAAADRRADHGRRERAIGGAADGRPDVGPRTDRRPLHAHRSHRQATQRQRVSRQADGGLFRLHLLPRRMSDRPPLDLPGDRRARSRGRWGAADLHQRRSGARHAPSPRRLRRGVSSAPDRPDRHARGDQEGRARLQGVLCQRRRGRREGLRHRPHRRRLPDRPRRRISRLRPAPDRPTTARGDTPATIDV